MNLCSNIAPAPAAAAPTKPVQDATLTPVTCNLDDLDLADLDLDLLAAVRHSPVTATTPLVPQPLGPPRSAIANDLAETELFAAELEQLNTAASVVGDARAQSFTATAAAAPSAPPPAVATEAAQRRP